MLELSLKFNAAVFAAGDPITGTVALRNDGPAAIKVNARLALNTPYAPAEMREIVFEVTNPTGAALEFQAKVNVGFPSEDEFKTLEPGQALEHSYDLDQYYDLGQPGAYSVRARYQNQSEPAAANGAAVWQGEVASPPVTFTVRA